MAVVWTHLDQVMETDERSPQALYLNAYEREWVSSAVGRNLDDQQVSGDVSEEN